MNKLVPLKTPVAMDYETALTDGTASVEFYRSDFRATSCAFSWREGNSVKNLFLEGEFDIKEFLCQLSEAQNPVIAHNLQFETGVTLCRFPGIELNFYADTARMAQVADRGGTAVPDDDELSIEEELARLETPDKPSATGLSLKNTIIRWLDPKFHGHKDKAHDYLKTNFPEAQKKPGQFLHLLPKEMLEEYNVKDAEYTLRLFYAFEEYFKSIDYDYRLDHDIHVKMCDLTAKGKIFGIAVDRNYLERSVEILKQESQKIVDKLKDLLKEPISQLEARKEELYINSYKSEKGKTGAKEKLMSDRSAISFNMNSTKQKTELFVDIMGLKPVFFTKKGAPSFSKSVLTQWGEAGLLMKSRGTLLIAQKQAEKLLEKAQYDGRWHVDINPVGAGTGRMSGAGGLNAQGLSRREKLLMAGIVADPGHVLISRDLNSGEPTVVTHFSQDRYYKQAIFDMVGHKPYYDALGTLLIDDIYLMAASISPMGSEALKKAFREFQKDGLSFQDQWIRDPEPIKSQLAQIRSLHKILVLGIMYEMGGDKMVKSCFEKGFTISSKDAKAFIRSWWKNLKGVDALRKKLKYYVERDGHLVTAFGYRLIFDKSYKAMNGFIQSHVSGIINCLCIKHFYSQSEDKFVKQIHDEIVSQCPIDKVKEAEENFQKCVTELNEELGWSVKIRSGFVYGNNLYEAK